MTDTTPPRVDGDVTDKLDAPLEDPGDGKHLWLTYVVHSVSEDFLAGTQSESRVLTFTDENVVRVSSLGCYKCETRFHPELLTRRCEGSMEPAFHISLPVSIHFPEESSD